MNRKPVIFKKKKKKKWQQLTKKKQNVKFVKIIYFNISHILDGRMYIHA